MTATASVVGPAERVLVIDRLFDAPRELVFRLWTQPEHLVRWFAPQDCTLSACDFDIRPGGAYRCCMTTDEGREHWLRGVYREIVAPERLVFTHGWEGPDGTVKDDTLVTAIFTAEGQKTRLQFQQAVFTSGASRDSHGEGWESCFVVLDEYLASNP